MLHCGVLNLMLHGRGLCLDLTVTVVIAQHYREVLYLNVTLWGVKSKCYRVKVYV